MFSVNLSRRVASCGSLATGVRPLDGQDADVLTQQQLGKVAESHANICFFNRPEDGGQQDSVSVVTSIMLPKLLHLIRDQRGKDSSFHSRRPFIFLIFTLLLLTQLLFPFRQLPYYLHLPLHLNAYAYKTIFEIFSKFYVCGFMLRYKIYLLLMKSTVQQ